MSVPTNPPTPPTTDPQTPTTAPVEAPTALDAEPKTFDADYVAKLRQEAAKYRTDAKANADAAKRLAEIEEAQKTETQKLADRLAAAEKKAQDAELKALRSDIAQAKGVPAALLTGSTEDELNASADALIAFRGGAPKPPAAPPAEGVQGNVGKPVGSRTTQEAIDAASKAGNHALAISLKRQLAAENAAHH